MSRPRHARKSPGQSADQKQPDEAEGVQHRRVVGNRSLVERGRPVKHFDRRRDGHQVAQERKRQRGVDRFAGQKHVVRPDEEPDHRDGDTRAGDEGVSEDGFAREGRNDFADHTHGRKNHDVHGRVRIKPEQVLEQDGIAAQRRIEEAQVKHALQAGEQQRDGDYRRAQNKDDAGGVVRPYEQRQPEPGHARSAHGVNGHDEIQPGQNRRKSVDEDAEHRGRDRGIRIHAAQRRVERPAGIQARRSQKEYRTKQPPTR